MIDPEIKAIEPCPVCGGSTSLEWDAVTECYGMAWQTGTLSCNEDGNLKSCWFSVSVTIESDAPKDYSVVENILIEAWNKLSSHYLSQLRHK